MKKEMSSFDVRALVAEMSALEGAHMDKIFQWGSGNVLFRINVSGEGKKELFFKDKKWVYMPANKPETPINPLSFATYLRKYINNALIGKTIQAGFDRVIIMDIMKTDADYKLIFEMFGGGNVLLVLDGKIMNCLVHKTMRDRSVRPGEEYVMPRTRFDPASSSYEEFAEIFSRSTSDLVRTLATGANLGGQYAEEVCARIGIPKDTPSESMTEDWLLRAYGSMRELVAAVAESPEPAVYYEDGVAVDFSPVPLTIYKHLESKRFDTLSQAMDGYMESLAENEVDTYTDPEIERIRRRGERQRETIEGYRTEAEELKKRAEAVYTEYGKVDELLKVLGEQSSLISWEKLKAGAMKIPYVVSIDPSKNLVTAEVNGHSVTLNYTKNIDANASDIYQRSKDLSDKAKRADDALKETLDALEKKEKGLIKEKRKMASRAQPTKQFWFERYKWFITTGGRLVIAGRDAHTNDGIVKKHLKDNDVYAHADVHGAPSVILKEGKSASDAELREACIFAITQSKGWVSAVGEGSAFWVFPDQVSKTPEAGEFVPRGAFIIRGKRNYEYHIPLKMAVGEITYMNERKVMCAPVECIKDRSSKYFIIEPGRGKAGKTAAQMARELSVPEEEVSRIIPPGDSQIVSKVWHEEPEKQISE
ncbi:MAG: ribosome rescue protein RqcH [Candidatus Methanomethylophilaceae archaeon]|nr:ribosome rescue protein RqcH [Candidatus Methanomethylophilaceae archaeon]